MNIFSWLQLIVYVVVLIALAKPLGSFMARVYQGERTFLDPVIRPVEKLIYRLCGVDPDQEMNWKVYAFAMLLFNVPGSFVRICACSGCRDSFRSTRRASARYPLIRLGTQPSALPPTPTGRAMAARRP